eukprot:m.87887 g.87887  ORF g.87887 m.87887 type:complete len:371 (+) comp13599_c0_seq1:36-1148(+)
MAQAPLPQLHACARTAFNLSPQDQTYIFDMVAAPGAGTLAVSASNHVVKVYDRNTLQLKSLFQAHAGPITSLNFSPVDANMLLTFSRDGSVKMWDLRTSQAAQEYRPSHHLELHSGDINSTGQAICAGSELSGQDAHLVLWDVRAPQPVFAFEEAHSDDITQVRFSRVHATRLASGSTDGLVNVIDTTTLAPGMSAEQIEDCIQQTHNSSSSISKLCFFGPADEYVAATTHTDDLFLGHALARPGDDSDQIALFRDLRRDAEKAGVPVEYAVDIVYEPASTRLFLVCGTHDGNLSVYHVNQHALTPATLLPGGHTETVRAVHWDPATGTMVSGGEDSMLVLWGPNPPAAPLPRSSGKMHTASKARAFSPY